MPYDCLVIALVTADPAAPLRTAKRSLVRRPSAIRWWGLSLTWHSAVAAGLMVTFGAHSVPPPEQVGDPYRLTMGLPLSWSEPPAR